MADVRGCSGPVTVLSRAASPPLDSHLRIRNPSAGSPHRRPVSSAHASAGPPRLPTRLRWRGGPGTHIPVCSAGRQGEQLPPGGRRGTSHAQRGQRCWSGAALLRGGGSGVSWQLQPGDRGEAEGRPGEGARHPVQVTRFFWRGAPHIPWGALPGLTLGTDGSGGLSLSWARPRQHRSAPGHRDWVWEGPRDLLHTPGEKGSHSLDLPESTLLHQFHLVLALEPGGGRRQQSATTSPPPREGPGGPPPPRPRPYLARSRGSIRFLLWKLLNRSRRMLPSGCGTRRGLSGRLAETLGP